MARIPWCSSWKSWMVWGGALALVLATPAFAGQDEIDQVLADMGSEYYQRYCASCHGPEGRGNGPAAAALRARPADLTRIAARRGGAFPDAEIATYIDGRFELAAHGTREMPVWGEKLGYTIAPDVHPDEVVRGRIVTLVEYLKTIQRP